MKKAKSVDETHLLSFTAIAGTRDGTEGFNFHIWDTMITRDKMFGNRFDVIVVVDWPTMFTKIWYTTFIAWDSIDEVGEEACEMVPDEKMWILGQSERACLTLANPTMECAIGLWTLLL